MMWLPPGAILVPLDLSEAALGALSVAREIAGQQRPVAALHVLPDLVNIEPGLLWETLDSEKRIHHAQEQLRKHLDAAGFAEVDLDVVIGDAGHEVAEQAKKISAALVVIPSHGRKGLARWLIGSVAERVVRLAPCPVLVLRRADDT